MGSLVRLGTSKRDTIMSPTANSIETQSPGVGQSGVADQYADGKAAKNWQLYIGEQDGDFILSYQPHTLQSFSNLLKEAFGMKAKHTIYADFKPLEDEPDPAFYIHVIEKLGGR